MRSLYDPSGASTDNGTYTYVATHVDDCAVVSASVETDQDVRDGLLLKYKGVKWEDQAETFVGLALRRGQNGNLLVHQPAYTRHVCDVLGVAADGVTFSPNGGALLSRGSRGRRLIWIWYHGCVWLWEWCST